MVTALLIIALIFAFLGTFSVISWACGQGFFFWLICGQEVVKWCLYGIIGLFVLIDEVNK